MLILNFQIANVNANLNDQSKIVRKILNCCHYHRLYFMALILRLGNFYVELLVGMLIVNIF